LADPISAMLRYAGVLAQQADCVQRAITSILISSARRNGSGCSHTRPASSPRAVCTLANAVISTTAHVGLSLFTGKQLDASHFGIFRSVMTRSILVFAGDRSPLPVVGGDDFVSLGAPDPASESRLMSWSSNVI